MGETVGNIRNLNAERARALLIPREHGAWGILLIPFVTGACIGMPRSHGLWDLTLFAVAAVALFWLRTPLESWMGTSLIKAQTASERRSVIRASIGIGAIATSSLLMLLWGGRNPGLLLIGVSAGAAFAAQSALKLLGRKTRMLAQIVGAIGLTSTAAGAYYLATGQLDKQAFTIWAANWLIAGDQIHFVQVRLHNSRVSEIGQKLERGRTFFIGQFAMLIGVAYACATGTLPTLAFVAFVPIVIRGLYWFMQQAQRLELHWIGITELLHSVTFAALFISSYYLR